jgi:hypothetical protein
VILALALGYATYLPATEAAKLPAGMKAGSVGGALMTAIAKGCVPHVAGLAEKGGTGLVATSRTPSRAAGPSDGVSTAGWGKPAYARVPTRIGEVWVAAYANGNCLVHGWGDALPAMRAAVHGQFEHDGSPWETTGLGHYRLILDAGPRKGMGVEARAAGEIVDRPEIQAEEIITFQVKPAG